MFPVPNWIPIDACSHWEKACSHWETKPLQVVSNVFFRGPDAFAKEKEDEQDGEGMGYHAFMRKHLKQHGGNMAKAAAAYRQQKGGGIIDDLERDIGIGGKPDRIGLQSS
jgi:hypothetical protein